MANLIWAATFLLLILISSMVAAAALIGMPISGGVEFGVGTMALLLVGWGYELMAVARDAPLHPKPAIM
jgi:hypothetical protein